MKIIKKYLNRVFIDGLSGMALGLFATLIIGTIIGQIAGFISGSIGLHLTYVANIAKTLMGAGIGVGVASKFKASPLVAVSAAVAGMIGAFPTAIAVGSSVSVLTLGIPGNPLSAFVAAYVAIEIGIILTGKTPVDIIVIPLATILSGAFISFLVGPYIADFTVFLGNLINVNVEKHPFVGGIFMSVTMGIMLTLPISSAAIGVMLSLNGIAAGAATIGCCCQMVGFAVMSYKENKIGGLISQGLGTSMIQMPNIIKKPIIWLPPIIASAIIAPISTILLRMESNKIGAGMGTSGLVGQFQTYATMVGEGMDPTIVTLEIILMHIVLPAIITLAVAQSMRKAKIIKDGDLRLNL